MQYHLNGVRPGDPTFARADEPTPRPGDRVDVAIVGCGPAGLTLAAQLAAIGGMSVRVFERKAGPLELGQADGIACRSMEMFQAFGLADRVMKEAYWVNETTFWRADPDGTTARLRRADRVQDVEDGLSEMPHVILNQARVHDFLLDVMRKSPLRLVPEYSRELVDLTLTDDATHPVTAVFERTGGEGGREVVQARHLVGCDGARSRVRAAMGLALRGESARQLWGVMDVLAVTDFPDIRLKCAVQSARSGSLLIIPREGGYLVRLYIELDALRENERAADRNVSPAMLERRAREILAPYQFEVKEVAWWSAYEIGQRVCEAFDDLPTGTRDGRDGRIPRLFIAGDACHTHSPKAGQGMNVSMADAFNLGWKLAAVLRGTARPELLRSYSAERQAKAQELIDFDRDMARLFSERPETPTDAARFQRYFQQHGRYTAGVATVYAPSLIVGTAEHQHLADGFSVGMRFHSAPVIRMADARPMQLGHAFEADGRWRIVAFADATDDGGGGGRIAALCQMLATDPASPVLRHTPVDQDADAVIDLRAVFQCPHRDLDPGRMPDLLMPRKGRYGLIDYEKVFCPAAGARDIFDLRGIERGEGALVVVRPDQVVSLVLPLHAHADLAGFFGSILVDQQTAVRMTQDMRAADPTEIR